MRFLSALTLLPGVLAHTWIEQLRNVDDQGNYVGEYGYPRAFVSKTDPGYNGESMNWQLPQNDAEGAPFINADTPLCHPEQRKAAQSSENYPRLQATPGDFIAMRYMENGHITDAAQLKGKPEKGGPIYVFATTEPKEDEKLADVLRWTTDGQGGDKRGVLLTVNDFDDGRCYELKPGNPESEKRKAAHPNYAAGQPANGPGTYPLFCETNVGIPKDVATGKPYTLYWVWQWNTVGGADPILPKGKDEYYTTCIDVDVVNTLAASETAQFGLAQQDGMDKAVPDFRQRKALITDPIGFEQGPVFRDDGNNGNGNGNATTTGTPSMPPQTTFATSTGAPYGNSTASLQIPTLTRPPGAPTGSPGDAITVTVTERITITASVVTPTVAPPAKKRTVVTKLVGAKFRY
ncbi:hypothetical protein M011DRAFT_400531 [Sporormia fimetaria CBS 119925]|uniref:DUF7492 domain-containing protein n=1 Tax=Sporormia fimetaria CBS 119925 TaxID=1340428 RepID=A0A6A6VE91_9PLEO|nr:hypothetical protein M011DRAFT_400531 [Sporormia fimetaria CBS 119925]